MEFTKTEIFKSRHLSKDQKIKLLQEAINDCEYWHLDTLPHNKWKRETIEEAIKKDVVDIYSSVNDFDHFTIIYSERKSLGEVSYRIGNKNEQDFFGFVFITPEKLIEIINHYELTS
jgi:hypothetical protein